MSTLKTEFEFEIGDVVYFKTAMNNANHTPNRFSVFRRIATQFDGGTTREYYIGPDIVGPVAEVLLTSVKPQYE